MLAINGGILTSPLPKTSPGFAANKTLWQYVEGRISAVIDEGGDKDLVIDGATGLQWTYSAFGQLVKKAARLFYHRYGVRKGSVVIICSNNTLNLFVALYGAAALGAVIFAVPAYSHDNIPSCLKSERHVPLILCDEIVSSSVLEYVNQTSNSDVARSNQKPPTVILLRGEHPDLQNMEYLLSSTNGEDLPDPETPRLDENEEAVVFFSSGSTGPPKPISHSHKNVLSISYNTHEFWTPEHADDIVLLNMNHAHIGGFMFFLGTIAAGSTLLTFSDFTLDILLNCLQRYQPSIVGFYPKDAIALSKVDGCEDLDFASVKEILAGAAMFPCSIISSLKKIFKNLQYPIRQVYGSTEVFLVANTATTNDAPEIEVGVGHLMPHVEMKVLDVATGIGLLAANERGELCFKTPFLMLGYRNRPDLTKAALTEDGCWYRSGDYGYYDEQGRVHVVDRVKDLILLTSGNVVSPSAIENVILRCHDVVQAGVTGIQPLHNKHMQGSLPRAFVVKRPGSHLVPEDIVNFVKEQTNNPDLQLTGGAEFVETMVTSPGGKVYRMKLKEDYQQRLLKETA